MMLIKKTTNHLLVKITKKEARLVGEACFEYLQIIDYSESESFKNEDLRALQRAIDTLAKGDRDE